MNNKIKISECFECGWSKVHPLDVYVSGGCGRKKQRIPRKAKNILKQFLWVAQQLGYNSSWPVPTVSSCEIADNYKSIRPMFRKLRYFKKYYEEIIFLRDYSNAACSPICIDDDLRLGFHWESDGEYGGSSGVEPLTFTPPQEGDRRWQYAELKEMLSDLGLQISAFKNEKELLIGLKNVGVKELKKRAISGNYYLNIDCDDSLASVLELDDNSVFDGYQVR